MKVFNKKYKNTLDKNMRLYRKKMSLELRNLRKSNSKEYWKILNRGKTETEPNIPIESLFEYFKNLNETPIENDKAFSFPNIDPFDLNCVNENLNKKITQKEILDCNKRLKYNKAHGDDHVINEYIQSTSDKMIDVYIELFNIIFETGIIPDSWLVGYIKLIYKNKGDKLDPKNFRPITILCCVSKLFTTILNERLNKFSDDFLILCENQTGF
jgi:hypothetical protein